MNFQRPIYSPETSTSVGSFLHFTFIDKAIEAQFPFSLHGGWYTETPFEPPENAVIYQEVSATVAVWEVEEAVVHVNVNALYVSFTVAATNKEVAQKILDEWRDKLPQVEIDEGEVSLKFRFLTPNGADSIERKLAVHPWDTVEQNYGQETKSHIENLLAVEDFPEDRGKLILWHGEPGTGKTHALRAVIQRWKSWVTPEYIVDPEALFGDASYMMKVLLSAGNANKHRLLICEDTGELLSKDAANRTGQGLSRCLNTVDGFIGQGMKIVILITTNEVLSQLHPAISRQGRTHSVIEFKKFSAAEASDWLGRPVDKPKTLADLYALRNEVDNHKDVFKGQTRRVGFVPNNFHLNNEPEQEFLQKAL